MNFGETLIIRSVSSNAKGSFTGLASSWSKDRHGDVMTPGAFASSIAALKSGTRRVPLLQNHDERHQIGTVTDANETTDGLVIQGKLVLGTPAADRAHQLMLADALGLSVGFLPIGKAEPNPDGGKIYRSVDLVEVSAVATPSNRESRVLTVKSLAEQSPAELERLLRTGELPEMPRRLAKKLAGALRSVLEAEAEDVDAELEPIPAEVAALNSALARLRLNFKR